MVQNQRERRRREKGGKARREEGQAERREREGAGGIREKARKCLWTKREK